MSACGINNIKCLFIGGGDVGSLKQRVYKFNIQDTAIVIGYVEKTELNNYYSAADATILTSLSEGFGLSIVEGYVYGKPNLTFSDLPAVKDLYSKYSMLLCPKRKTDALSYSMLHMANTFWDRDRITAFANNFSFKIMTDRYIKFYHNCVG